MLAGVTMTPSIVTAGVNAHSGGALTSEMSAVPHTTVTVTSPASSGPTFSAVSSIRYGSPATGAGVRKSPKTASRVRSATRCRAGVKLIESLSRFGSFADTTSTVIE